jgi:hypothetical protein
VIISEIIPPRPVASNIVNVIFGDELIKIMNAKTFIKNFELATLEQAMSFPEDVAPEIKRRFPKRSK